MSMLESIEPRRLFSFTIGEVPPSTYSPLPDSFQRVTIDQGGEVVSYVGGNEVKLTSTGTLFVRGTSARDRIAVRQDEAGKVSVFLNDVKLAQFNLTALSARRVDDVVTTEFDASAIKRIKIDGGGGRDLATVEVAKKIRASMDDRTGKDVLTRFAPQTQHLPPQVRKETGVNEVHGVGNKIFWGQEPRVVSAAPAGVTPLASISHIERQLAFEATPDLIARFVKQEDGTYLAYGYNDAGHPGGEGAIIELTLYDYTGILRNPVAPPVLTADGQ